MPANKSQKQPQSASRPDIPDSPGAAQFREKYDSQQELLNAQPAITQRFLESQARSLADAAIQRLPQLKFNLPDKVTDEKGKVHPVPNEYREQMTGGLMDRITRTDIRIVLRQRLIELEQNQNQGVAIAAGLVRHVTAVHMVHNMLPSGRTVQYQSADGEEIPTIPVSGELEPESAITAPTDAIAEEDTQEVGRGELLVPYVPYARRFYLPQWVAFDEKGELLVGSVEQAEADIASMQRFLEVLHAAVALAAYMVADEEYQRKRYGMLGQLINQGRALCTFQTKEIIKTIKRRARSNDLNRGLSLSLPYFDDQDLQVNMHDFEIIPAGRIMFIPAFVVLAAQEEQVKVAQDTRLSASTRKHLLEELAMLEHNFDTGKR